MNEHVEYIPLIIPTVLIPLTLISVGLSVVATFIAGLFGIELKAEGPKQLLEVLLKPRVIFSAILLNIIFVGGFRIYHYYTTKTKPFWIINKYHNAVTSNKNFNDIKSLTESVTEVPIKLNLKNKIEVKQVWIKKLPKGSFSGPTYSSDSLFFGTDGGYIYEVNDATGEIIREFYLGTPATPTGIIFENQFFIGEGVHDTHHARIYNIDLKTGKHKAHFNTKGHTEGSSYITSYDNQDYLIFGAGVDGLYAVDPITMNKIWSDIPGHIDASVSVSEGKVYVGTGREKTNPKKATTFALAYDLKTGKQLWKEETPLSVWMKPAVNKQFACFVMGEIYFESNQGMLGCYNKNTGEPDFSILMDSPVMGDPFVIDEDIIINTFKGTVCRIDTTKRIKKWCFKSKAEGVQMASAVYDQSSGVLALATSKNGIYFLNPQNGNLIAHFLPTKEETLWDKTYASPRPTTDGWITVDMKGHIRKLKLVEAF